MQELQWCADCEDRPVDIGQLLCDVCAEKGQNRIGFLFDTRTGICPYCRHLVSYHGVECPTLKEKQHIKLAASIMTHLLTLLIGLLVGWLLLS